MSKILFTTAVTVLVASLSLYIVAVWTGDTRWSDTANVLILPGSIGVFAAGIWVLADGDF